VRHRNGSVALFSDLFRLSLLRRGLGTWIDTDVYFVAPIDAARPILFGRQSANVINGAVLRLPPDSPLLAALLALFDEQEVPFWLDPAEREAAARRLAETGRTGLSQMPWGTAGPNALTALARRMRVDDQALPESVFYPVPFRHAGWILNPGLRLEEAIRPETVAVHLWNALIKDIKDRPAPAGSFLARLQEEGS
jgi:hypothetical protein